MGEFECLWSGPKSFLLTFFSPFPCRFKAAWCSVWEGEALPEIFGEVDVVADSLVDMADKIIEAAKSS